MLLQIHVTALSLKLYIQELHLRYYEPLARVEPSLERMAELHVKKLLFMTDPRVVDAQLMPHWQVRTPLSFFCWYQASPPLRCISSAAVCA